MDRASRLAASRPFLARTASPARQGGRGWAEPLEPRLLFAAVPTLSVGDVTRAERNTGTTAFNFTVLRSGSVDGTSSVRVRTEGITANADGDNDFTEVDKLITFADGQSSAVVTVLVNGDRKFEPDETFRIRLSSATNATIAHGGLGTILNDDVNARYAINQRRQAEGSNFGYTSFLFNLSRTGDVSGTGSVRVRTEPGTANAAAGDNDYQEIDTVVTFAAGVKSKAVTVKVYADRKFEKDENFLLLLSDPVRGYIDDDAFGGFGVIANDDRPGLRVADAYGENGEVLRDGRNSNNKADSLAIFEVTLEAPSDRTVTVAYETRMIDNFNSDEAAVDEDVGGPFGKKQDFVPTSGTLTFAPGETKKIVTVLIKGDGKAEGTEYFNLHLSGFGTSGADILDSTGVAAIMFDKRDNI